MPASSALRKQPRTEQRPVERPKRVAEARAKAQAKPRLFHARMLVTRLEEWCVEATTAAEAEALLVSGAGHRCSPGESIAVELESLLDE